MVQKFFAESQFRFDKNLPKTLISFLDTFDSQFPWFWFVFDYSEQDANNSILFSRTVTLSSLVAFSQKDAGNVYLMVEKEDPRNIFEKEREKNLQSQHSFFDVCPSIC